MAKGNIKRFCQSVLPEDFQQVTAATRTCQSALDTWLPERLHGMVQVTTVDAAGISIAASTPVVANYLRLHLEALRESLIKAAGKPMPVQIKTRPASVSEVVLAEKPAPPAPVKQATIAQLSSSASAIEDEALRQAMHSLAKTLTNKYNSKD